MSQKLKVELQDENGNIYYLHTAADVVYLDDGTTVEAALEKKVNASGGDISNTKLATLAAASASFPVPAAGDAPKTLWGKAKKWQQDCLAKFANYVLTSAITNQYLNDTSKIPTAALMYLLKQEVNGLNSELDNKSNLSLAYCTSLLDYAESAPEGFCHVVRLAGSGYTGNDLPETGNYKFGSAIVMKRYAASMVVLLFSPVSNGPIMVNTWDDVTSSWNGWYNTNGTKQLWNGTLNVNGSVTIPDIDRYSAFAVINYTYPIVMFGYKLNNNVIYGSGMDCNSDYGLRAISFQITLDGSKATLTKCKRQAIYDIEEYADDSITRIYGIL